MEFNAAVHLYYEYDYFVCENDCSVLWDDHRHTSYHRLENILRKGQLPIILFQCELYNLLYLKVLSIQINFSFEEW